MAALMRQKACSSSHGAESRETRGGSGVGPTWSGEALTSESEVQGVAVFTFESCTQRRAQTESGSQTERMQNRESEDSSSSAHHSRMGRTVWSNSSKTTSDETACSQRAAHGPCGA